MSKIEEQTNLNSLINIKNNVNNQIIEITSKKLNQFVNNILKRELIYFSQYTDGKKPFSISQTNSNLIVIKYPTNLGIDKYDMWYESVEKCINHYFYKKETSDEIPQYDDLNNYYVKINNQEYKIKGNIVIKSIPIHIPKREKKNKKVSETNKKKIKEIKKEINKNIFKKQKNDNKQNISSKTRFEYQISSDSE